MNVIVEDFSVFAQYPVDKTLTGKLRVRNLGVSLLCCPSILSCYILAIT